MGQKVAADGYEWIYTDRIQQVETHWLASDNLYVQPHYLQALEGAKTPGLDFRYLLIFKNGQPIGGITLQLLTVSAAHSIRSLRQG